MDEFVKSEIKKVFHVAAFLFITIFFILPYLVQVSTYFHERGHQRVLEKYGIESYYQLDLLSTVPDFFNSNVDKLGVTRFNLADYKKLNKYQRAEINIAGIVSDLRFLFLISIYLSFINIYMFYRIRFTKNPNLIWILAINWILFMWLLALVQITVSNVTNSSGDVLQLIKYLEII